MGSRLINQYIKESWNGPLEVKGTLLDFSTAYQLLEDPKGN